MRTSKLQNTRIFSVLDVNQLFWQVQIDKVQNLALPTALLMSKIFEDLDESMDDLLLWGENDQYHNTIVPQGQTV